MRYYHRFIVVENRSTTRTLIITSLKALYPKADISTVGDGQRVIEMIERSRTDLVICDKNASPIDGFELTRTLRAGGIDVPIIIMSDDQQGAQEAKEAGATLFMNKLGIPNLLPLVVSRLLRNKELA